MRDASLKAAYFDGIFEHDDDPWNLACSDYEAAKFAATCDALAGRRYDHALEIGCAHGVFTKKLVDLCNHLVALDISAKALAKAQTRVGNRSDVTFQHRAFPGDTPADGPFDLIVLSEVAYYWSLSDLDHASEWLRENTARDGRIILVHYTGQTDYPQSGDEAVKALWTSLNGSFDVEIEERNDRYRLDLWVKR